jgi:chromosome segregation ATPase
MSSAETTSNDQETLGELRTALDESHSQIDRYENELARLNAKIEELERLHEVQEAEIHSRDIELEDMKEEAQKLRLENTNEIANLSEALELEACLVSYYCLEYRINYNNSDEALRNCSRACRIRRGS